MTRDLSPAGSRRQFLITSGAALAAQSAMLGSAHAAGSDQIKVGLVGCGGRGSGAADNVLHSAPNVTIVALGDAFKDRAEGCRNRLMELAKDPKVKELGNKVDVPPERVFVGLDAIDKVLASDANYIILATPPGFRSVHLAAAVAAGKNIFTEKPVGVDAPGIRMVLEAYDKAKSKGLGIAAGTQRRHQLGYLETMKRIHDGAIGDLVGGRCYWNQGILWKVERQPDMSDLAWQMRNWYNFTWLCGDHIVEQHVHNIDVINWAFKDHPVRAVGMGGRTRTDPGYGHIFDHFAVDYEYPNGVHVMSMCRQISNCENSVSEALVGTKGTCRPDQYAINGKPFLNRQVLSKAIDPYVQEHTDLIESIRAGKPINELKNVAESTLTAILGRMSTYTGKALTWDQVLHSKQNLMPEKLAWDMSLEVPAVAVPGKTQFA